MKKVLLFDLDQTILNRNESLNKFLNWQINFMQLVPLKFKESFIQRFIELDDNGRVWKDQVYSQLIQEFNITNYSTDDLLNTYTQDFNKFSIAFDQAEQIIKSLHLNGYILGLISNGKSPFQEHNFYALGLQEYFSILVVSEAIGLRKPEPEIFLYACQQLNCATTDCIFIGDNPTADITDAKNVGMHTIHFQPKKTECCVNADEHIQHYRELEPAINRIENLQL